MKPNILFIGEGGVSDDVRLLSPANFMGQDFCNASFIGYNKKQERELIEHFSTKIQIAVIARPHSASLILGLQDKGIKVVADQDDDFLTIPRNHPGYKSVGKGNPTFINQWKKSLEVANMITVTNQEMEKRIQKINSNIRIIPNGWEERPLWNFRYNTPRFTIGWGGTITHRDDFLLCKDHLINICKKYKTVEICIVGDPQIYFYFNSIPEDQKRFLPFIPYTFYPYSMASWDVAIAPLDNTPFNIAKSDIKLVQAGAKGMAWIASSVPEYVSWKKGGLLVTKEKDWFECIATLIENQNRILDLEQESREKAREREIKVLGKKWIDVMEELL